MGETRRKFDHDFRKGAVRLVGETGKPVEQVARDLGINEGTLGNWVNADKRRRQRALLLDTITLSDGEDQRERTQCRLIADIRCAGTPVAAVVSRGPMAGSRTACRRVQPGLLTTRQRRSSPCVAQRGADAHRPWNRKGPPPYRVLRRVVAAVMIGGPAQGSHTAGRSAAEEPLVSCGARFDSAGGAAAGVAAAWPERTWQWRAPVAWHLLAQRLLAAASGAGCAA